MQDSGLGPLLPQVGSLPSGVGLEGDLDLHLINFDSQLQLKLMHRT